MFLKNTVKIILMGEDGLYQEELKDFVSAEHKVVMFIRHATEKNKEEQDAQFKVCVPYISHIIASLVEKLGTENSLYLCSEVVRTKLVFEMLQKETNKSIPYEVTHDMGFNPFAVQHQKVVYLDDIKASDEELEMVVDRLSSVQKLTKALRSQLVQKFNERRHKFISEEIKKHSLIVFASHSVSIIEPYSLYVSNSFNIEDNSVFNDVVRPLEVVLHIYNNTRTICNIIIMKYSKETLGAIERKRLGSPTQTEVVIYDAPIHEKSHA